MVGKVLAWKKSQPEESERVWNELSRANEELREVFDELRKESEKEGGEEYRNLIGELSQLRASEVSLQ